MNDTIELNPQKQEKAKEYARIRRRLMVVGLIIDAGYALMWLTLGWAVGLKDWLLTATSNEWLLVAGFAAVIGGIESIISLPLSYYSGFVLPHRYELSNQTFKDWVLDRIKGFLVGAPIGLLVLELIYLFLRTYPHTWWIWAAGFLLFFSVILGNLAPILIMPLFNKYTPLDEEHADLAERLLKLAEKANTKVRGVYKFDMSRRTKAANAGLTGLGNTRRIILGDTLLKEFSADEIETILAHELGHHINHDIPLSMVFQTTLTLGGLYLTSLGLSWGISRLGFGSISDIASLPLFGLSLGAYGLITSPLSNGFSRWREGLADDAALHLIGKGDTYASALTRLSNQNLAEVDPEPWVEFLLYSHPSLNKRIQKAQRYSSSPP